MEWSLAEITQLVEGELRGDPETRIRGIRSLEQAGADDLSFVRSGRSATAEHSRAGVLLVPAGGDWDRPVIEVADPDVALVTLLTLIDRERQDSSVGVHPTAVVAESAGLGDNVVIAAGAYIADSAHIGEGSVVGPNSVVGKGARLGRNCWLAPNVTIYPHVTLDDNVRIHSSTVIGADGFGYVQRDGRHVKLPHVGGVRIESDVEIGAATTIDAGMIDPTVIRAGAKIDDHCHIAHNCDIGELSLLAGGCRLSGSVKVGKGVVMGGATGASDNLTIGDGARLGACTVAFGDIEAGSTVLGTPARDARQMLKAMAAYPNLGELRQSVRRLLDHVGLES